MEDIQSAMAENMRGKKTERKKEERESTGQKCNVHICYTGLP